MMRVVEIGKIWLPENVISAVENHRKSVTEANKGTDVYDMLQRASFAMWFSDYIYKFGYRMEENGGADGKS